MWLVARGCHHVSPLSEVLPVGYWCTLLEMGITWEGLGGASVNPKSTSFNGQHKPDPPKVAAQHAESFGSKHKIHSKPTIAYLLQDYQRAYQCYHTETTDLDNLAVDEGVARKQKIRQPIFQHPSIGWGE